MKVFVRSLAGLWPRACRLASPDAPPGCFRKRNASQIRSSGASSILVTMATSALLKMVGYFRGLSSASVTETVGNRDQNQPQIFTQVI
jgi:hypothetical protein